MSMSPVAIVLSDFKDTLGLIGTVLIAMPFFRLEVVKRRAVPLINPPTRNKTLLTRYSTAHQNSTEEMGQPSVPDFTATIIGLLLLGASYFLSIVLTTLNS